MSVAPVMSLHLVLLMRSELNFSVFLLHREYCELCPTPSFFK